VEASSKKASAASSEGVTIKSHRSYWKGEDDVSKKIADIHITPFDKGQEMNDANAASARARARILELEKELEVITRKAMTTQVQALKTAKQMAAEAYADEANMTSSVKKSKKVMIESSAKVNWLINWLPWNNFWLDIVLYISIMIMHCTVVKFSHSIRSYFKGSKVKSGAIVLCLNFKKS